MFGENIQTVSKIIKIDSNYLIVEFFNFKKKEKVNLSNFIVYNDAIINKIKYDELNYMWYDRDIPTHKNYLIENGFLKIKDISKASKDEIRLQDSAIKRNLRIHHKEIVTKIAEKPIQDEVGKENVKWDIIWEYLKWIFIFITTIFGSGAIYKFILNPLYIKYVLTKRVNIIIVGEPSVGKTKLFDYFENHDRDWESGQTTPTKNEFKDKGKARKGYILNSEVIDIGGSNTDLALDSLLSKKPNKGLVIVLSPTINEFRTNGPMTLNDIEKDFINKQCGAVRYIAGSIRCDTNKSQPKVVVLYISKFDLFSNIDTDENKEFAEKFKNIFKEHIMIIEKVCNRKPEITFKCFVGSTKKKWKTRAIEDTLLDTIILNKKGK